ncbi:MAG TPA: peptidoglycan-binding protein [Candidatus Paceibacterota bacterium]|jgi:peptidoglycan hydrolase-like protein with peptidoglycan-binding domain
MTIANTKVIAKVAAALAVVALSVSMFAVSASAQTTTTTTTTTSASSCASFNRDLTVGATGADVTVLQNWLISKGFTIAAGATGYFGGQTQAALARYQASVGISPAAGYFGPITRAKVNSTCGTTNPGTGGTDDDDDDDDDDNDDDMGDLEGGAGDLESADYVSDLNNEDVGEGDEEVAVAGLELEAEGSDLGLSASRVTIRATSTATNTGSEDLDDYAESISLWFDGEELETVDVDDIDEDDGEYTHTFSFDWEDAIIREGETGELTLAVTALEGIDSDDLDSNTFEVFFDTVRYTDAQGAVVTEDSLDDIGDSDEQEEGREFEFTSFSEANDVELSVDESDENPDEGSVQVEEDGDEEVVLLIGELEAEGADLEITEIIATITSTGSVIDLDNNGTTTNDVETTENVASEYCLMIDGDQVDCVDSDEETTGANSATATYTFDVEDVVVGADETLEFEIIAVLNELEEGDMAVLRATVNSDDVEAETEEDGEELEDADKDGTAQGETQTFRAEGLVVDFDEEASEEATDADNNVGEFVFVLDISSLGDETDLDESDFDFTVTRDNGVTGSTTIGVNGASADPTVTVSSELDSNDFDENNDVYEIDENEGTITFTVYVQIGESTDAGVYEVTLNDIENEDGTTETAVNEELSTFIGFEN